MWDYFDIEKQKILYNLIDDNYALCMVVIFNCMNKQIYLYSGILGIIASVICAFFNWRISTGVLIGVICSYLYFYLLNIQFNFKDGKVSKGGILGFGIRILVIALPLLIACLLPNYFNIFGAFGGVMLFRFVMMYIFFKQKGE